MKQDNLLIPPIFKVALVLVKFEIRRALGSEEENSNWC